jgi:hypothetical protein
MGKGMMNGLVIYRDLYDQKGPYLYLLYGIAYLISHKTFLGVFIFEIIAAFFFLYFAFKMISEHSNDLVAALILPVLAAGVYSSWSFYKGGAAEEFCLPMFAYSIYELDRMLRGKSDDKRIRKAFTIAGICAGVTAQIKYTMLGLFFGWFVVAVIFVARDKSINDAIRLALRFILFAIIPSLPWLIYFLATGSLDDWFRCYIYNNLFFYSKASEIKQSLSSRFIEIAKTLLFMIEDNFSYFVFIILGVILQFFMEKKFLRKFTLGFMFVMTFFVIFFGGNKLPYYSIPLMVFAIWGSAYIGELIFLIIGKAKAKGQEKTDKSQSQSPVKAGDLAGIFAFIILLICSTFFAAGHCVSSNYRHMDRASFWLTDAAKYLSEDDTLLNLSGLDAGLYTVTGIVPSCEYFQTNGIGLPTMFEEQHRYIAEKIPDYIVVVGFLPDAIEKYYDQIEQYEYDEPGFEETYYLFKRKP